MMIIVASLGIRQGLMVGLAIPACFLLAFLMINAMGVTLNQMVMFGMVLAVGILVDGGIVVVEYADRKMAEGMPKEEAFAAAGKRMFWPVVNGTLTTLCAFLPFMFWNSIAGKFMSFLPLTLFFVLGASIFVALIFTPALGSIFGRKTAVDAEHLAEIEKSEHGDPREMNGFMGWYARTHHLRSATTPAAPCWRALVDHRRRSSSGSARHQAPHRVLPRPGPGVRARSSSRRAATSRPRPRTRWCSQVEGRLVGIKGIESHLRPRRRLHRRTAARTRRPTTPSAASRSSSTTYEERKALGLRGKDIADDDPQAGAATCPACRSRCASRRAARRSARPSRCSCSSHDPAALDQAADLVKAKLAADPQLIELEDNRTSPGIEWNLTVDREAAGRYGVDVLSVGQAIQFLTGGVLVGRFRPDDAEDELDIRVRFPADARNVAAFDQLKITTPPGPVPASYFVKRVPGPAGHPDPAPRGPAAGDRPGQHHRQGVAANQKIAELKPWLEKADIDPAVHWKFIGADEEGAERRPCSSWSPWPSSLFLMAVILLWQFNSFYGVLVTLSAVVLSTVGVLLGVQVNLLHTFDYISVIMLGTGVVALAGVVVGHNIVLVDTFYQLRRQGFAADEAAVRAATQRFRPVMLTTLVTVVGLLPLMFQIHPNFHNGAHRVQGARARSGGCSCPAAVVWGLSLRDPADPGPDAGAAGRAEGRVSPSAASAARRDARHCRADRFGAIASGDADGHSRRDAPNAG